MNIAIQALTRVGLEALEEDRRFRKLVLEMLQGSIHMSQTMQIEIEKLRADVGAQTTVIASAETLIRGFGDRLAAAEASAASAGATQEQLTDFASIRQDIETSTKGLALAVQENTLTGVPLQNGQPTARTVEDSNAIAALPLPTPGPLPSPAPVPATPEGQEPVATPLPVVTGQIPAPASTLPDPQSGSPTPAPTAA